MWAHAHTDLGDLYRESLTLRQIAVRIEALPPDAHLWAVLRDEREKSKRKQEAAELQAMHNKFRPKKG